MSDFLTQFPKTQGERIAALRQARDLSQRQLAEAIKCHKNSVDELARQIAQRYPDALLLFARPFSDAELEMLTGAFRSIAAHRAEVAREVEAARATVPIANDPALGVAKRADSVG